MAWHDVALQRRGTSTAQHDMATTRHAHNTMWHTATVQNQHRTARYSIHSAWESAWARPARKETKPCACVRAQTYFESLIWRV